jgi:leucyl aminopeptidase (aminopeptidase T)
MQPEYAPGARNAVRTCLNVQPDDRVAVISDQERADIAEAIVEEARAAGGDVVDWKMEDWVARPATEFPRRLADEIRAFEPSVSYYVAGSLLGELAFRRPMLELLGRELRCRHGHMVGIDRTLMLDGMTVDYDEVYRVTHRVHEIVREASRIEVATRPPFTRRRTGSSSSP